MSVTVFTSGFKIPGRLIPLSQVELSLGSSVPGEIYEIHIETDGIPNPKLAAESLVSGLRERFGVRTVWIQADAKTIRMQIIGSPFAWATLIPFIPLILTTVGVAVVLISVFLVFREIPPWVWGLLAVGLILIYVSPFIKARM